MVDWVNTDAFKSKYAFLERAIRALGDANIDTGYCTAIRKVAVDIPVQIDTFNVANVYPEVTCPEEVHADGRFDSEGKPLFKYFNKRLPDSPLNQDLCGLGPIPPMIFPFVLGAIVLQKNVRTLAEVVEGGEVVELCIDDPCLAKKKEELIDNALRVHVKQTSGTPPNDVIEGLTQNIINHGDCPNVFQQMHYLKEASLPDMLPAVPMGIPTKLPFMTKDSYGSYQTMPTVPQAMGQKTALIGGASDLGTFNLTIDGVVRKFKFGYLGKKVSTGIQGGIPGSGSMAWDDGAGNVSPVAEVWDAPVKVGGTAKQVSVNSDSYYLNADLDAEQRCMSIRAIVENYNVGKAGKGFVLDKTTGHLNEIVHPEYGNILLKQIVVLQCHIFVVEDLMNHVYCMPTTSLSPPGGTSCIPVGWAETVEIVGGE